jgi:acyl-homoserine lactone acylase PvdQ
LADLDRSLFMIAVGQSGHPASNHFDDLNRPWRDGEALTLPAGGPRNPASTLVLEPLFKAGQTP